MSIVVETSRLVLRHLEERDAAFILELVNDPDWLRFIGDRGFEPARREALPRALRHAASGAGNPDGSVKTVMPFSQ